MSIFVSAVSTTTFANTQKGNPPKGYTVKKGETLISIAKKFNMSVDDFKKQTGLKNENIRADQVIKNVPTHTVKSGETMMAIAKKYGMTVKQLCDLNNIKEKDADKVNVGTVLYVYGKKSNSSSTSKAEMSAATARTNNTNRNNSAQKSESGNTKVSVIRMPSCGYICKTASDASIVRTSCAGKSQPSKPVDEKGNVVAEVIKFLPSNKGDLSGKTIMVNAGHGWGTSCFKPGTQHKDSNGRMLQEWYKNRDIAEDLIKELCNRGATVIFTTGDAPQVCTARKSYRNDLLISIHCNASDNKSANGLKVMYDADNSLSVKLKDCVQDNLKKNLNNNTVGMSDNEGQHSRIGILHGSSPSVMVEMGFMSNSTDIKNIDSKTWQRNAAKQLADAVESYFDDVKKEEAAAKPKQNVKQKTHKQKVGRRVKSK